MALGISFIFVGTGVIVGLFAAVVIYMTIVRVPARKYETKTHQPTFTGVNASDAGIRQLLNLAQGALPYHWLVSATADAIEIRTNNRHARPIVVIRREHIVSVSIGALAGGAFVHRSLDLEIGSASDLVKLAFLKDAHLGIGTDGEKALERKAQELSLVLALKSTRSDTRRGRR